MRFPDFFIVGASRAGTTSLYEYLKKNPKIFMPSRKEPHFFSPNINQQMQGVVIPITNEKEYLALFKNAKNDQKIGESSVTYLTDPDSPSAIYKKNPNAKIIIILRNPIERTISDYLFQLNLGTEKQSFEKAIERDLKNIEKVKKSFVKTSLYSQHLNNYFKIFPKNQIKILIFEDFIKNPQQSVYDILRFLGINVFHNFDNIVHNEYKVPKGTIQKFILNNETLQKLAVKILPTNMILSVSGGLLLKKENKPDIAKFDTNSLKSLFLEDKKLLESMLNKKINWAF